MRRVRLFWMLVLALVFAVPAGAVEDNRRDRMCWAHYVGWGFNQVDGYDLAARTPGWWMLCPFVDRSLLGRNIQWDTGIFYGARRQIETALAYGVDGFCVDVVNPNEWTGALSRFFRDAEGTSFKVALCIDRLNFDNETLIKHLDEFIRTYQDHPNASRIDGRMVIFVYNLAGKKMDEWLAVREELRKRGLDAYYLVQPMHETSMWNDAARLEEALRGFESLYDFGCNGFTAEQMKERLANGRAALKKVRPDGMMVGGIAVGYIGQASAYYRPFLNSGTVRQNWDAALANDADWVCLTTWNDYIEDTQFEPSVINRDNLLLLNREYLYRWRREAPPARPARVLYSYHEEAVIGDDVTIEIVNFSYTGKPARVLLRLLDETGKLLREFPALPLNSDSLTAKTIRLTQEELKDQKYLRLQAAVVTGEEKPVFKELYPIVRRFGRVESVRTIRLRQDDITAPFSELKLESAVDGKRTAIVTLHAWVFAGKAELLRNGWPVAEQEISHSKAPKWEGKFTLPEVRRSPEDCYLVRFTDVSGRIGFSTPALDRIPGGEAVSLQPVVVTGSDFDENWPLWANRISRLKQPKLEKMKVAERDLFAIAYDFNEPAGMLVSNSGWSIPAQLGCNGDHMWWGREDAQPQWVTALGPDGVERSLLRFDGKANVVAVAARSLPYGPLTLELLVRPEAKNGEMMLFHDQAGVALKLDGQLRPSFTRGSDRGSQSVTAEESLAVGEWAHVAAVYTGDKLLIYLNGKLVGQAAASTFSNPVNSVPRIGNSLGLNCGFQGDMAGFRLESSVRTPKNFKLLNQ